MLRAPLIAVSLLACKADSVDSGAPVPSARVCPDVAGGGLVVEGPNVTLGHQDCGSLSLAARVLGDGDWTVAWQSTPGGGLQPVLSTQSGGTVTGLVLEGAVRLSGASGLVFWKQGYQSWSWSGVTAPGTATLDDEGVVRAGGDGDGISVLYENDTSSWWGGLLGHADGAGLMLGVQGATRTRFYVGVDGDRVQAVWGNRGEAIAVPAGGTLELDPLWGAMGSDPNALHEAWADAVATRIPPRSLDTTAPTGWATWYQYYSEVSEEDVRTNLDELEALASGGPPLVDVFQVDDGWQVRWGDWQAGDDFPSGMPTLASDIAAAGFTPGLWLAPFYMSTDSETFAANEDWWVRDDAGELIRFSNLGTGDYVILDVTHPDAAAWLEDMLSGVRAQGWDYLKLDFLYAGAQEGVRQQDVTGIEAYHIGMDILRRASGDAWVLACGAPLLPTVGYAESMRTGADIGFEVSPDPQVVYYRWQLRSTAARQFTHGRWWWMDPDQLIVRPPLTDAEVRGALASAFASGGTWMLGDALPDLADDRLQALLDPALFERLGQTGRPHDPLAAVSGVDPGPVIEEQTPDDDPPLRYDMADGTVVLVNLTDAPRDVASPGGTNLLTSEVADAGMRTLAPGDGEIWVP